MHRLAALHILCITLVLSSVLTTIGQTGAGLSLDPKWKKGEKRTLELTKTREDHQGTTLSARHGSRTNITVTVLEASANGYLMEWTLGKTTATNPRLNAALAGDTLLQGLLGEIEGARLLIELDKSGSVTGLRNWQEWKEIMRRVMDRMRPVLTRDLPNAAELDRILSELLKLFDNQAAVQALLLKEATLYFHPFGFDFQPGKPVEYDDRLPNVFGGEPFPSKARLSLREHDAVRSRAVIDWKQTLDPVAATRIMKDSLTRLARLAGKAPPGPNDLPSFDIQDEAVYEIDLKAGWMTSLRHKRTAKTGDRKRMDSLLIEDRT